MKMNILIVIDGVEFCFKYLYKKYYLVSKENVIIVEVICFFSYDKLLEEMWEGCKFIKEGVKLEVFWNILNEFIYEIDINIEEN